MKPAGVRTSRIARAFGFCLVLAILLAASAFIWTLRLQEIHKWEKQSETFSLVLAENTSQQMDFAYTAISSVAERIQDRWSVSAEYLTKQLSTEDFHQMLAEKVALFPAIEVISVLDVHGDVVSSSRQFPAPKYNLADRDYFEAQRDSPSVGIYLSNPVQSKATGEWLFFLSHRLTGSDGEFIGAVIVGLSPNFYAQMYEKLSVNGRASISLLREDLTYLARWPENSAVMGQRNVHDASMYQRVHEQAKRSGIFITGQAHGAEHASGTTRMTAIKTLDKYPLILNFSVDEDVYLADWRKISMAIAIVTAGAIAAVIAAFRILIQLFLQRERDMQDMTALKREADVINQNQTTLLANLTQQQTALKVSSDRLTAIFENAADGIVMIDDKGLVEAVNPVAEAIYGYSAQEVIGKNSQLFAPPGKQDLLELALSQQNFQRTGKARLETERVRKDGTPFPAELSISAYQLAGERKLIIIVRDISERRKIERMKAEFISTVSHELRTPLTSIRGALGLIGGGAIGFVPEKMRSLIQIAQKNSESLTRLINDLLDVQKIEAGKMDFEFASFPLRQLLDNAIQQNQSMAGSLGVSLVLDEGAEPDLSALGAMLLRVDAGRFQQVMANLISNACKYSPDSGQVRVMTQMIAANRVRIIVADQGNGVPENFRDRIFEKFSQADSSDTRSKGGTGLGLAISKVIVHYMDGDIGFYNASPEQGGGAHFYIDLPLQTTTVKA